MRTAVQQIKRTLNDVGTTVVLPATGKPVEVEVRYDEPTGALVFTFGDQVGSALAWKAGGYALVINFVWADQPFPELFANTPSCWFSGADSDGSETRQTCCVPPVPGQYHIAAEVPDGDTGRNKIVDPVIVVTPIVTP